MLLVDLDFAQQQLPKLLSSVNFCKLVGVGMNYLKIKWRANEDDVIRIWIWNCG